MAGHESDLAEVKVLWAAAQADLEALSAPELQEVSRARVRARARARARVRDRVRVRARVGVRVRAAKVPQP